MTISGAASNNGHKNITNENLHSDWRERGQKNRLLNKFAAYTKITQLNNPPGVVSLDYMNEERITYFKTMYRWKKKCVIFSYAKWHLTCVSF